VAGEGGVDAFGEVMSGYEAVKVEVGVVGQEEEDTG
jgi:hypothetical protein